MAESVPDRSANRSIPKEEPKMLATCGHEDAFGYFMGTVCDKCVKKARKKMGFKN